MQIGILGREIYTKHLKKSLGNEFKIKQLYEGDELKNEKFKDLDVLISMTWGRSVWGGKNKIAVPSAPNLKLLQLPGSGTDGVNFSLLPKNCKVCNVYEHEIPISEYVISNILNFETGIFQKINTFKKNNWKDSLLFSTNGHGELHTKKIGILGLGRIGKEIAKKVNVFGVNIIAISRDTKKKIKNISKTIHYSQIQNVLPDLDYLIISCDLNKTTLNIISEKNISLLKKSAVIVNIARGPIINEKALYYALEKKKIGGAIIDTWYRYPSKLYKKKFKPAHYNFSKFKNIIMTPHLSCLSSKMLERRMQVIRSNIIALSKGTKLKNLINY